MSINRLKVASVVVLALLSLCVQAGLSGCDEINAVPVTVGVDFGSEVQPIFDAYCTGCHSGPKPSAFLDLSVGYSDLVDIESFEVAGIDRVSPGVHFNSYLFFKINCANQIFGGRMPLDGAPLSLGDQALIRDWINQILIFSDGFD